MELGSWRDCPSLCGSARLRNTHTTQSRAGCTGASSDNSQVVPRHGQWPRPTHWSLATVTAPCLVLPKPDGQHGGGRAVAREDIGSPPCCSYTLQCLVCLSVRQISLLLHVRSGLGYPDMPLSCLPSWTPGPRVSTQTHANHPRQKETRDQWT